MLKIEQESALKRMKSESERSDDGVQVPERSKRKWRKSRKVMKVKKAETR